MFQGKGEGRKKDDSHISDLNISVNTINRWRKQGYLVAKNVFSKRFYFSVNSRIQN